MRGQGRLRSAPLFCGDEEPQTKRNCLEQHPGEGEARDSGPEWNSVLIGFPANPPLLLFWDLAVAMTQIDCDSSSAWR